MQSGVIKIGETSITFEHEFKEIPTLIVLPKEATDSNAYTKYNSYSYSNLTTKGFIVDKFSTASRSYIAIGILK